MDVSKHSRYKDFVWAIQLNRFGLELIGLWPGNDEVAEVKLASDLRVGIIFVIVTLISGIPLVCSLVRVWGDMILMIDNLQITLPLLIVSLKLVVMRRKRMALLSLVKMMAEDWMELKTAKEKDVMIGRAHLARAIVISGYVLMVLAFIVVIVLPYYGFSLTRHLTNLTDPGKPLPLQTYYFYDINRSPQFELTFLIQAITIFLAAVVYTSVDAFLGLTILHLCGQLENFKGRIAVLSSCQNFIRVLSNNVMNHLRLIRFASIIEDTFTLMMLGLVFYFGIVFCLHGFLLFTYVMQVITGDFSFAQLCFPIIGITILFTHTFLYCGAGEIVTNQCEGIYRAMCDLEWYKLESRKAKSLIPLMIRAKQPFRITAGKIFPLTMTTFCSLLKTSAGYISFLLAQRE
ncbi:ObirOr5-U15 [Ooceraea biroi]|uniref:Odorant receptor n=2 Tax=Ooceraea biroi TaxID=2015173 RepID=A0A3L8DJF7_OOCBI|nr:ObirOr5-U15 [Ooceraea biroi]